MIHNNNNLDQNFEVNATLDQPNAFYLELFPDNLTSSDACSQVFALLNASTSCLTRYI